MVMAVSWLSVKSAWYSELFCIKEGRLTSFFVVFFSGHRQGGSSKPSTMLIFHLIIHKCDNNAYKFSSGDGPLTYFHHEWTTLAGKPTYFTPNFLLCEREKNSDYHNSRLSSLHFELKTYLQYFTLPIAFM